MTRSLFPSFSTAGSNRSRQGGVALMVVLILLVLVTLLPWMTGMSGVFYLGGALVLGAGFLYHAVRLLHPPDERYAMRVFGYSVMYLMLLFAFLLVDHYLFLPEQAAQALHWHRLSGL